MADSVEFYLDGKQLPFLIVDSSFQPNDGDLISLRGETWIVLGRSFSVDYADDRRQRGMRCNLIVERHSPPGAPGRNDDAGGEAK